MNAQALTPFVFRHGRVGDMVMQTALSAVLHRRYGAPCQIVGAGPWNQSVVIGNPDVGQCWTVPRHAPFVVTPQWPRLVHAMHQSAPGPIYVAEYQYRQLPRVRRLLRTSGIDMNRCVFIDENPGDYGHWIDALIRLGARTPTALRASDYPVIPEAQAFAPRLFVLDSERRARDMWLREHGWLDRVIVLVQPGNHHSMSVRSQHRWGGARRQELANRSLAGTAEHCEGTTSRRVDHVAGRGRRSSYAGDHVQGVGNQRCGGGGVRFEVAVRIA